MKSSKKFDVNKLKGKLTPMQYKVTQENDTELPFENEYWNNKRDGIYVDVVSGEPLFSSRDKYDSGSGWPSFTKPIKNDSVHYKEDKSIPFMERIEVRSKGANSHLGHVFDDGPGPSGQRFCVNSASMKFVPVDKMQQEGYGEYLSLFDSNKDMKSKELKLEKAILAGGCFWGMEEILRKIDGVTDTVVGYSGGTVDNPTYETLKGSGHAEAVEVTFDPSKITYEELLSYFFRMHNPTTKNKQGNDVGSQYRSAIFYTNDDQLKSANKVKKEVEASRKWKGEIVTEIVKASKFFKAEDYHQDYLQKHPGGYTCHFLRE